MKYEIPLHRTESKTVQIFAETPHEALQLAKESHPGFTADSIDELIEDPDEPGTEIMNVVWDVFSHCEGCGVAIITGDKYFAWGGEDSVNICLKCGGADETHEPSIA